MPCDTKVIVKLDNTKYNRLARKKLGFAETGGLTTQQAGQVRIEAGKLKTISAVKKLHPTAFITGTTVGSPKLTLRIDIGGI